MKRIEHTSLLIGLFVIFFVVLKLFEKAVEYAVYSSLLFFGIVFVSYWWTSDRYEKYDLWILGLLVLTLGIFWVFNADKPQSMIMLQITGIQSFALVFVVMIIGPLTKFVPTLMSIYFYRRHLGVIALMLGMVHAGIIFSLYFNNSHEEAFAYPFVFYGFTGLIIMIWLGVSSWDYLQLKIKKIWWQVIHTALLAFWGYQAYEFVKLHEDLARFNYYILGGFVVFWLLTSPYGVIGKFMNTWIFGWKQVHALIYIAYAGIVLHLVLGVIEFGTNPIFTVLGWGSLVVVVGLHSAGWIKKYLDDRVIYKRISSIGKMAKVKDQEYVGVARKEELSSKKGLKTYVNKKPVALFSVGSTVHAVSDVCPHQKGPLHQGRIIGNCVECPWHFYPYDLESGKYAGKQSLKIDTYDVLIKEGIVFVSVQPKSS